LSQSGLEQYIITGEADPAAESAMQSFLDQLKDRIDQVKEKDTEFTEYVKQEKERRKRTVFADSDLNDFMD